jgi:hypothetical protein
MAQSRHNKKLSQLLPKAHPLKKGHKHCPYEVPQAGYYP